MINCTIEDSEPKKEQRIELKTAIFEARKDGAVKQIRKSANFGTYSVFSCQYTFGSKDCAGCQWCTKKAAWGTGERVR